MTLFRIDSGKCKAIRSEKFKGEERGLQAFVETNLQELFGLEFLDTEFAVAGFRVDTVAFDPESKSFVIIEYKRGEDYSVIDQGFAYLNVLLSHKGDFQILLQEKLGQRIIPDFSQSRVIFIAKSFNPYQQAAMGFKELPIELWKYSLFEDNIFSVEAVEQPGAVSLKAVKLAKSALIQRVSREVKAYRLEDHLEKIKDARVKDAFLALRDEILKMDSQVREKVRKNYVAYELRKNFVEFEMQRSALNVSLDVDFNKLDDPKKICEDCSAVGHWATGDTRFKVRLLEEVPYAISLIRQSYEANK